MRTRIFGRVGLPILAIYLLGACTTVDLTQVSLEKTAQTLPTMFVQNVVEKASTSMTALFVSKGWCKDSASTPTQTAASVLLNGRVKHDEDEQMVTVIGSRQLSADLNLAQSHIMKTTKAAEIYLATADEVSELSDELSMLEAALLSAKEAEAKFGKALLLSANPDNQSEFESLEISIHQLKKVTNAYGDRMRGQIASKSSRKHS